MNTGPPRRAGGVTWLLAVLLPLLVLATVWAPPLRHFHVVAPDIPAGTIERLRHEPADAALDEITRFHYGFREPWQQDAAYAADELLAGRFHYQPGVVVPVGLAPDPASMETGAPTAQLNIAGLTVCETLLMAWERTGEERYFSAALQSGLAWIRFERGLWLPRGFIWNEHAIASRVVVLSRLWRAYRHRADFDPGIAREILGAVAASTIRLADPNAYIYRTNHGIMQDLALLHAAVAFPGLPDGARQLQLALGRLDEHLPFYVADPGTVLEHSTGYHEFAIKLLSYARAYLRLLGAPDPGRLGERLAAANCALNHLTRPDGTMPLYGDTGPRERSLWDTGPGGPRRDVCAGWRALWLDTDFGYASLREEGPAASHLFVTWADFPGHSHKHDDDLAALLWAAGEDWWTTTGYWPYGFPDRDLALGWRGSNAPHAAGEAPEGVRTDRLLAQSLDGGLRFLDLERATPGGERFRRQVVALPPDRWFVVDMAVAPAARGLEVVWTSMPGVTATPSPGQPAAFELASPRSAAVMDARFAASPGLVVQSLAASHRPFGGWVSLLGIVNPAHAIETRIPGPGVMASAWRLRPPRDAAEGPLSVDAQDPLHWTLTGVTGAARWELRRDGDGLGWRDAAGTRSWPLAAATPPGRPRQDALDHFRAASGHYTPFRDYLPYRARVGWVLVAAGVLQLPLIWVARRSGAARGLLRAALLVAWGAVGWWLYYRYFV